MKCKRIEDIDQARDLDITLPSNLVTTGKIQAATNCRLLRNLPRRTKDPKQETEKNLDFQGLEELKA